MNLPVKQSSAPHSATESAQPQSSEAGLTHPKIARRPSQWKQALPAVPKNEADAPASEPTRASTHLSWQDDARFGVWLVVVIVALNIMLARFTDKEVQVAIVQEPMIQQVMRDSVLPTPMAGQNPTVHMFATPEQERRTIRHTTFSGIEEDVVIDGMNDPAPRAHALESYDE